MEINWQPSFDGKLIVTEPLRTDHFDSLFQAASDPLIWEQHPAPNRHKQKVFELFFQSAIESKGALLVREKTSGETIGSSRFLNFNPAQNSVEIGYTFLIRRVWGNGSNAELKQMMLNFAFAHVNIVEFFIGAKNWRSRKAVEKLGASIVRTEVTGEPEGDQREHIVYGLTKKWDQEI